VTGGVFSISFWWIPGAYAAPANELKKLAVIGCVVRGNPESGISSDWKLGTQSSWCMQTFEIGLGDN